MGTEATMDDVTSVQKQYAEIKQSKLSLDLTRGKPSGEQLSLCDEMQRALGPLDYRAADGTDCRNYGGLDGIAEARELFGALLEVSADRVLAAGNSSLTLMHDTLVYALLHGVPGGKGPWSAQAPRFLCPSPGYDRHFAICEHLGIEMLPVGMNAEGPDMEAVRKLVADGRVKGMWLVPKYGNPTGVTLSAPVVRELARMKTAAPDFRIMWDNAYAVHDLEEPGVALENGLLAGDAAGNADRFLTYASLSKVTVAGAGIAAMAASAANLAWMRGHLGFATIGPDKMNQLRHVRFLKNADGVRALMRKHAAILKPKFELVERVLQGDLGGSDLATWTKPRGGYFVSLDVRPGQATKVVRLAGEAGVKLTPAGSSFPYRKDPRDTNIRLAPSFPSLPELERAMQVLTLSIRVAGLT
jgi:DNA-binding transcriptional MocR family regulator